MQRRNYNTLRTPIIGRVIQLNKLLLEHSAKLHKKLQHNYADDILKKGDLLFTYAMRQLKGKDYFKRSVELTEEIQANVYLVHSLGGYNARTTAIIDSQCDEIISHLYKMTNTNVSINTSTDKVESTKC